MEVCRCGHGRGAHEHYRAGADCAQCDCPRFRDRQPVRAGQPPPLADLTEAWLHNRRLFPLKHQISGPFW